MGFELIVPTILESELTGYLGGVRKTVRGKTYQVDFHSIKPVVRMTKDGAEVEWHQLPKTMQRDAQAGGRMLVRRPA